MTKNIKKEAAPDPAPTPVPEVKSLSELQALCEKKLRIEFTLEGRRLALEARRLTPSEDAVLDNVLNAVVPPMIRGTTPEQDRVDYTNGDFQTRKKQAELQARAQALYWCVPIFSAENPGLTDIKAVTQFVQSKLNEEILSILWQAVRSSGVSVAELVNFT